MLGVVIIKIGIIDADLNDGKTRFPNLALMKIAGYNKSIGNDVELTDFSRYDNFDHTYVSKVFDYTYSPSGIEQDNKVTIGGTGYYFDKAPPLQYHIEHSMPDYSLYSDIDKRLTYYHNASIGFTTRGCFRHCEWCVNRNTNKVVQWSPIDEFYDDSKKIISLWDDNILGCSKRIEVIESVIDKNKSYEYKQGMDIRLVNEDIRDLITSSKYHGDYIFAFDDLCYRNEIIPKLDMWLDHSTKKNTKLYVLVGFKSIDYNDIREAFERIKICMEFSCLPYIMRFKGWDTGDMRGMYINLARWCNQPGMFKKISFREFVGKHKETSSTVRYANEFELNHPNIAKQYYDLKYGEIC